MNYTLLFAVFFFFFLDKLFAILFIYLFEKELFAIF